MSKQLALSIALSVLAMTAFALLGVESASGLGAGSLRLPVRAAAPELPSLTQLLPALQ
ncbi:MAG: hypothetical protein JSR28_19350 [Proteobacteria bacterium]|nr:hypothetical protein [Pseudomonadota bacterium]MDE2412272.1 hypothetical protein [Sphingomonadales bacterium]